MKFDSSNILLNVDVNDKNELFAYIASYAKKQNIIEDEARLVDAFLAREAEVSTGLQESFAIPHAKANFIKEPTIIYVKLKHPIEWETFDEKPVQNIFTLLVPDKYKGTIHLYAHVHNTSDNDLYKAHLKSLEDTIDPPLQAYNVGCMIDYMNYTPRTLEEIIDQEITTQNYNKE